MNEPIKILTVSQREALTVNDVAPRTLPHPVAPAIVTRCIH